MDRPNPRRFLILDGITLVASAALMLSANRIVFWIWGQFSIWFQDVPSWNPRETTLMAWSLGLLLISPCWLATLLSRREDRDRLRRGAPGLLVHFAAAVVVLIRIGGWLAHAAIYQQMRGRPEFYPIRWTVEVLDYLRDDLRRDMAVAVVMSWITLWLVSRWSPERAWDDRLGRLVGMLWIAFYLMAPLLVLLP